MNRYCYTTTVSNYEYFWGAMGLYFSLKKHNSKYQFIMLIAERVSKDQNWPIVLEALTKENIEYRIYTNIQDTEDYKGIPEYIDEHNIYGKTNAYCEYTLEKYVLFDELQDYDKVLFIDADIIICTNIDFIFDKFETPALQCLFDKEDVLAGIQQIYYSTFFMLFNPNYMKYSDIVQTYKKLIFEVKENDGALLHDEAVIPYLLNKDKIEEITNISQMEIISYLYHNVHVGYSSPNSTEFKKYWDQEQLYSVELIKEYIYSRDDSLTGLKILNNKTVEGDDLMDNKWCYTTTISNYEYFWGAIGLYYSLKKWGSQYPFVLCISSKVKKDERFINEGEKVLKELNIDYRWFEPINKYDKYVQLRGTEEDWRDYTLEKFNCQIILDDFEKIFFIDADIILLTNVDKVFEESTPIATDSFSMDPDDPTKYAAISTSKFIMKPGTISISEIADGYKYLLDNNLPFYSDESVIHNVINAKGLTVTKMKRDKSELDCYYHHFSGGEDGLKYKYFANEELHSIDEMRRFIYNFEEDSNE